MQSAGFYPETARPTNIARALPGLHALCHNSRQFSTRTARHWQSDIPSMFPRTLTLSRFSFRPLLLVAFLLIALLLSATSVHTLLTLERLSAYSSETARDAIALTENAQHLAERTVAMERSARQFLVLNDRSFLERYEETWQSAGEALHTLEAAMPNAAPADFDEWRAHGETAGATLQRPRGARAASAALEHAFFELHRLNEKLALESKREVEHRNHVLAEELERQRRLLTGQLVVAILLAVALAFAFGLWLSRPLAAVDAAIRRLGENRFDQPIEVHGPADLRQLGSQLDWLRQRLAALENEKERFLRHVSHELKTPLAALREGIALLDDEVAGTLSDSQREIAGILHQNVLALQNQIEELLRYNAATFEAQHLKRAPLDLSALLRQAIDSQRLQWQVRGLRVETEGSAPILTGDADKLSVVLGNLLSNAVRFSPDGSTIRFVLEDDGAGGARIHCIDSGPGIAPDDMERVFEPFYQGQRQPPGPRRGNGIGLSIVREYIEAHAGTIQLLPHEGGAHFQIELPHVR